MTQIWPRSRRFGLQGDVRQDQSRIWCQAGGKQRDRQTALPQMAISAHLGRSSGPAKCRVSKRQNRHLDGVRSRFAVVRLRGEAGAAHCCTCLAGSGVRAGRRRDRRARPKKAARAGWGGVEWVQAGGWAEARATHRRPLGPRRNGENAAPLRCRGRYGRYARSGSDIARAGVRAVETGTTSASGAALCRLEASLRRPTRRPGMARWSGNNVSQYFSPQMALRIGRGLRKSAQRPAAHLEPRTCVAAYLAAEHVRPGGILLPASCATAWLWC